MNRIKKRIAKFVHRLASKLESGSNKPKGTMDNPDSKVEHKTTNSYKAAYLLMKGGKFAEDGIRLRPLEQKMIEKKGYKTQYVFHFKAVSLKVLNSWGTGSDTVSASDFANSRMKIKRAIKRLYRYKRNTS